MCVNLDWRAQIRQRFGKKIAIYAAKFTCILLHILELFYGLPSGVCLISVLGAKAEHVFFAPIRRIPRPLGDVKQLVEAQTN